MLKNKKLRGICKLTSTNWYTATPHSSSLTSSSGVSSQIVATDTGVGSNAPKVVARHIDHSIIRVRESWTGDNCREEEAAMQQCTQ